MRKKFPSLLGMLLFTPWACAVGIHQHGVAQLDLALEPPQLSVAIHSPLANLIGFEHPPATPQQQALWVGLQQQLQQAQQHIVLPDAAACTLQAVRLSAPFADHEHNHDHDHDHDHSHADLSVEYDFHCTQAAALNSLQLPLMQNFPAIERLDVQMLTPSGQHFFHLNHLEHRLPLP